MTSHYKYAKRISPNENSPYTLDTLPMHKDTYFFCHGIDIDKPIEMANQIIYLKEQLERSEKARKEAIDEIKELYDNTDDTTCYDIDKDEKERLLQILDIDKGE